MARAEILERLLKENHRRADVEAADPPKTAGKGRKRTVVSEGMEALFS